MTTTPTAQPLTEFLFDTLAVELGDMRARPVANQLADELGRRRSVELAALAELAAGLERGLLRLERDLRRLSFAAEELAGKVRQ